MTTRPDVTDEMVTAATAQANMYGSVTIGPDSMRKVLQVAMSTVAPAGMSPAQALDKAAEMVDKLSTVPMKSNGYPVDGWRAPTLGERVQAIRDLAVLLMEGGDLHA